MKNLIYKDLVYIINGCAFQAFAYAGPGYRERYYCQLLTKYFEEAKLAYVHQYKIDTLLYSKIVSKRYADFLIEDAVVLEIKIGEKWYKKDFDQINEYLKLTKKRLGLLILFTKNGARIKRIANL